MALRILPGLLLALALLCGSVNSVLAQQGPFLTFNVNTGTVYNARNPFDQWHLASLTKIMTAYTVFREIDRGVIDMNSPVRISEYALAKPPSKMGFPIGTILTVEAALKIILVKSANDVSTALAESVGGSEAEFVRLMNHYAKAIGMERSNFVNPHGLHDPGQYSTARDIAVLSRQIYREFPEYADLFSISAVKIGRKTLRNHNALLRNYSGTIGLKTGFICAGGVSLASSIRHEGEIIVSILFGERRARTRNIRVAEMLESARQDPGHGIGHIDELVALRPAMGPIDVSEQVCGRKGDAQPEFMFDDEAIEYFAIKSEKQDQSIPEREARLYAKNVETGDAVELSTGGATGPDPFELLVEKPPLSLAENEAELDARFETSNGNLVAIPTRRPFYPL